MMEKSEIGRGEACVFCIRLIPGGHRDERTVFDVLRRRGEQLVSGDMAVRPSSRFNYEIAFIADGRS